mmetsp:Transcript_36393/g.91892  ORF Transcript_36393/g.91892 Transcript_36393/m.91892 type:complete len:266 (-) Transcript_36393:734-1531(-)
MVPYRAMLPGLKWGMKLSSWPSMASILPMEKSLTMVWWVEDRNRVAMSLCSVSLQKKRTPYSRLPLASSIHQSSGSSMHLPAAQPKKKPHRPTRNTRPTTSRMRWMCSVLAARSFHSHMRSELKAAPSRPAMTKSSRKKGSCMPQSFISMGFRLPGSGEMAPCTALRFSTWMVNVDRVAAMKQRQAVLRDQKEQASSMENSTPPMGALKAALMPAHTPADTNSRWSVSLTISSSTLSLSLMLSCLSLKRPKQFSSLPSRTYLQSR